MKFAAVSDTHCHSIEKITSSVKADILLIAGDVLNHGTWNEFIAFAKDLERVRKRFKHIIYVPGNHDIYVDHERESALEELHKRDIRVLIDQRLELDGVSFFGSPGVPLTPSYWAFAYGFADQTERWKNVQQMDVLITHGPPQGILDYGAGCKYLRAAVDRLKPRLHVFGHMHECGGELMQMDNSVFRNVAICDRTYRPARPPFVFELSRARV